MSAPSAGGSEQPEHPEQPGGTGEQPAVLPGQLALDLPAPEPAPEPGATPEAAPEPEPGPEPVPTAAPAAERPGSGGRPVTGMRGLRAALAPRATRGQVVVGLLCLLLGVAVAVQVRQRTGADLAGLPQSELLGLLDDATDRSDRLQREISELETARGQLEASGDQQAAARELAQQRLDTLGILAGTLPASGPGIRLTVQVPAGTTPSAATLLLGAVQELRDAGAESIQIGDARVVASTAFTDDATSADGAVAVTGPGGPVVVRAPFTVLAVGGAQTLASAMEFPDGVGPTVRRVGGSISVEQLDEVEVTALQPAPEPAYARPVDPADAG